MDTPTVCARHPGRPAITTCARCGRGICQDDLVDAPVGYQCLDCARSAPQARTARDLDRVGTLTRGLVAVLALAALLSTSGQLGIRSHGLVPALVGSGEWWRLLTSALLHAGFLHFAFNALLLWNLGALLERAVGPGVLAGLVAAGTAGGGLGVVLLSWLGTATGLPGVPVLGRMLASGPLTVTVGASGAVFGLMGAVLAIMRRRGLDPRTTTVGSTVLSLVLLNLVLTFAVPAISVGGHVGGLAGGWVAGLLVAREGLSRAAGAARAFLLSTALLVAAIVLAEDLVRRLLS
jgi:membrane associated rhomboid family serine protease